MLISLYVFMVFLVLAVLLGVILALTGNETVGTIWAIVAIMALLSFFGWGIEASETLRIRTQTLNDKCLSLGYAEMIERDAVYCIRYGTEPDILRLGEE
jgi:hypothetical protein